MSDKKYLGTIRLMSGQGGWFDELTRIHLTLGNPQADVYAGQNLTNVRKGVHSGILSLVRGTLGPDPSPYRLVRVGNHFALARNTDTVEKKAPKVVEVKAEDKMETPKPAKKKVKKPIEVKAEDALPAEKSTVVQEETKAEEPKVIPAAEADVATETKAEEAKEPESKKGRKSQKKADAEA